MKRKEFDYQAAKEYISLMDEERVRWTKFVYGLDWRDPKNYDLVINLQNITIETACAMIRTAVRLPSYETTDEVKKQMRDYALACRVKVALAANSHYRAIAFDVRADGDEVEVLAEIATGGLLVRKAGPTEDDIRLIAKTVDGVKNVRVSVRRFPEFPD